MNKYKNILSGYLNTRQTDKTKKYLVITNVSDEPFTLEPNGKVFLNMTPASLKEKNPKIPDFSRSVLLDEEPEQSSPEVKDPTIPF